MKDYSSTNTDTGKLFAFTCEQVDKGADINEAKHDADTGKTIKPVLRMGNPA